jgi:hypothetical protein
LSPLGKVKRPNIESKDLVDPEVIVNRKQKIARSAVLEKDSGDFISILNLQSLILEGWSG